MVFFVCEGCNETVKKNQVDKHVAKCRNCYAVTCVDCQKSFYGDDYAEHTSCISEAEKYEKSLYKGPKVKANPQDSWMTLVMQAVEESSKAPLSIQSHIVRLGTLTNIPRNEKKFTNFVKNSLKLYNDKLIGDIWKYLASFKSTDSSSSTDNPSQTKQSNNTISNEESNQNTDNTTSDNKKRKYNEDTSSPRNDYDNNIVQDIDGATDTKEKKKKKKVKKRDELDIDSVVANTITTEEKAHVHTSSTSLPEDNNEHNEEAEKKKHKKKKKDKKKEKESE